ncbi:MAG TPA: isochorismatase family protein [Alphaproteobacteria bacterium]
MKINSSTAFLLVIDVQERLVPAMHQAERMVANCAKLLRAAPALGLPVVATEQVPCECMGRAGTNLFKQVSALIR